jgi:hypothetical protein
LSLAYPTATQAVADAQDTPVALSEVTGGNVGAIVVTVHAWPFQVSAKVDGVTKLPLKSSFPTAVQNVAVGHDTDSRKEPRVPAGLGAVSTDQWTPFQFSINGTGISEALLS